MSTQAMSARAMSARGVVRALSHKDAQLVSCGCRASGGCRRSLFNVPVSQMERSDETLAIISISPVFCRLAFPFHSLAFTFAIKEARWLLEAQQAVKL